MRNKQPPYPFRSIGWNDNEQTCAYLRGELEVAEGLSILGWPIVLNPEVIDGLSIGIPAHHKLNLSGRNEVHMCASTFTGLAVPAKLTLVEQMVRIHERHLTKQ